MNRNIRWERVKNREGGRKREMNRKKGIEKKRNE